MRRNIFIVVALLLAACTKSKSTAPADTNAQAWQAIGMQYETEYLATFDVISPEADTLVFHADGSITERLAYLNDSTTAWVYRAVTYATTDTNTIFTTSSGSYHAMVVYPTGDSPVYHTPPGEATILSLHDLAAHDTARIYAGNTATPPTTWTIACAAHSCMLIKL